MPLLSLSPHLAVRSQSTLLVSPQQQRIGRQQRKRSRRRRTVLAGQDKTHFFPLPRRRLLNRRTRCHCPHPGMRRRRCLRSPLMEIFISSARCRCGSTRTACEGDTSAHQQRQRQVIDTLRPSLPPQTETRRGREGGQRSVSRKSPLSSLPLHCDTNLFRRPLPLAQGRAGTWSWSGVVPRCRGPSLARRARVRRRSAAAAGFPRPLPCRSPGCSGCLRDAQRDSRE